MKLLTVLGIIFIVAGSLIITYNGFNFNKDQKIAQVGDKKLTISKPIYLSPTAGGVIIGAGVILLLLANL